MSSNSQNRHFIMWNSSDRYYKQKLVNKKNRATQQEENDFFKKTKEDEENFRTNKLNTNTIKHSIRLNKNSDGLNFEFKSNSLYFDNMSDIIDKNIINYSSKIDIPNKYIYNNLRNNWYIGIIKNNEERKYKIIDYIGGKITLDNFYNVDLNDEYKDITNITVNFYYLNNDYEEYILNNIILSAPRRNNFSDSHIINLDDRAYVFKKDIYNNINDNLSSTIYDSIYINKTLKESFEDLIDTLDDNRNNETDNPSTKMNESKNWYWLQKSHTIENDEVIPNINSYPEELKEKLINFFKNLTKENFYIKNTKNKENTGINVYVISLNSLLNTNTSYNSGDRNGSSILYYYMDQISKKMENDDYLKYPLNYFKNNLIDDTFFFSSLMIFSLYYFLLYGSNNLKKYSDYSNAKDKIVNQLSSALDDKDLNEYKKIAISKLDDEDKLFNKYQNNDTLNMFINDNVIRNYSIRDWKFIIDSQLTKESVDLQLKNAQNNYKIVNSEIDIFYELFKSQNEIFDKTENFGSLYNQSMWLDKIFEIYLNNIDKIVSDNIDEVIKIITDKKDEAINQYTSVLDEINKIKNIERELKDATIDNFLPEITNTFQYNINYYITLVNQQTTLDGIKEINNRYNTEIKKMFDRTKNTIETQVSKLKILLSNAQDDMNNWLKNLLKQDNIEYLIKTFNNTFSDMIVIITNNLPDSIGDYKKQTSVDEINKQTSLYDMDRIVTYTKSNYDRNKREFDTKINDYINKLNNDIRDYKKQTFIDRINEQTTISDTLDIILKEAKELYLLEKRKDDVISGLKDDIGGYKKQTYIDKIIQETKYGKLTEYMTNAYNQWLLEITKRNNINNLPKDNIGDYNKQTFIDKINEQNTENDVNNVLTDANNKYNLEKRKLFVIDLLPKDNIGDYNKQTFVDKINEQNNENDVNNVLTDAKDKYDLEKRKQEVFKKLPEEVENAPDYKKQTFLDKINKQTTDDDIKQLIENAKQELENAKKNFLLVLENTKTEYIEKLPQENIETYDKDIWINKINEQTTISGIKVVYNDAQSEYNKIIYKQIEKEKLEAISNLKENIGNYDKKEWIDKINNQTSLDSVEIELINANLAYDEAKKEFEELQEKKKTTISQLQENIGDYDKKEWIDEINKQTTMDGIDLALVNSNLAFVEAKKEVELENAKKETISQLQENIGDYDKKEWIDEINKQTTTDGVDLALVNSNLAFVEAKKEVELENAKKENISKLNDDIGDYKKQYWIDEINKQTTSTDIKKMLEKSNSAYETAKEREKTHGLEAKKIEAIKNLPDDNKNEDTKLYNKKYWIEQINKQTTIDDLNEVVDEAKSTYSVNKLLNNDKFLRLTMKLEIDNLIYQYPNYIQYIYMDALHALTGNEKGQFGLSLREALIIMRNWGYTVERQTIVDFLEEVKEKKQNNSKRTINRKTFKFEKE